MKIMEAIQTRIQNLDLSGIADADIVVGKFDPNRGNIMAYNPGVIVSPLGAENVSQTEGTNEEDFIYYPVTLFITDTDTEKNEPATTTAIDTRLYWRERIRLALWHKPEELITAGAPSTTCDIEWVPGAIVDAARWAVQNLWFSAMSFRVLTKEARG